MKRGERMPGELSKPEEPLDFVLSSKYRIKVLSALSEGYETASEISEEIGVYTSHVSRALEELSEATLVECVTPDKGRNRQYAPTEKGDRISDRLGILTGKPSLEHRMIKTLDDLSIPYARNIKLNPNGSNITADFVILDEKSEPKMAIGVIDLHKKTFTNFENIALWLSAWKNKTEKLKTLLVLAGKSKEKMVEGEEKYLPESDLFDVVIHGNNLECAREKELGLEEFLEVEDHCIDWSVE